MGRPRRQWQGAETSSLTLACYLNARQKRAETEQPIHLVASQSREVPPHCIHEASQRHFLIMAPSRVLLLNLFQPIQILIHSKHPPVHRAKAPAIHLCES